MVFEVRKRDLLGRLGRIETKSGIIETPNFLPVINPAAQLVSPREMKKELKCNALITNAFILKKQHKTDDSSRDIHDLIDFDGVVMTDSGAYQILIYGGIDVSPLEIVRFQEQISTDIATILDIPTGWHVTADRAQLTVYETIKRAEELVETKIRDDIVWVAPIQGGKYLDLIALSAKKLGKLPFQIHALGSPTQILEQYRFDILVDMTLTAKMNMPLHRPLHLFGAGHPFMFALAVAMGCDLFDSAAYAIYARQEKYMTGFGTIKFEELDYLPCSCPICSKYTPKELREMPKEDRQKTLAKHNLHACFAEIRCVKQRLTEGRLWEYLEARAHSHPALYTALRRLKKYEHHIERYSPVTKKKGFFFFSGLGLMRPEIIRYRKLIHERYHPPGQVRTLLLIPQPLTKPFHKSMVVKRLVKRFQESLRREAAQVHICIYAAPLGVVPLELDEIYPTSQHETVHPPDLETVNSVVEQIKKYVDRSSYKSVVLVEDEVWNGKVSEALTKFEISRRDLRLKVLDVKELNLVILDDVVEAIRDFNRR